MPALVWPFTVMYIHMFYKGIIVYKILHTVMTLIRFFICVSFSQVCVIMCFNFYNRIVLPMKIFHNGCIGTLRVDTVVYDNSFTLPALLNKCLYVISYKKVTNSHTLYSFSKCLIQSFIN